MKLAVEKNMELNKLSRHFDKIESLAMKMGVEVEDLIQEYKNNNTARLGSIKKSILAISQKRQDLFKSVDKKIHPVTSVIAFNKSKENNAG